MLIALTGAAWIEATREFLQFCLAADILDPQAYRLTMLGRLVPFVFFGSVIFRNSGRLNARLQMQSMVDATPTLCALIDRDQIVQYANMAFLRAFSPMSRPQIDVPINALLAPYLAHSPNSLDLPLARDLTINIALEARDGQLRTILLRIARISGNSDYAWMAIGAGDTLPPDAPAQLILKARALDTAMEPVAIADLALHDTPITYVNASFCEMSGYSPDEILGRNLRFLQGSDRTQPEIRLLRDAIRQRRAVTTTLRNYRRDGSLFWNEVRLSPVHDASGRTTHYISCMRDVTVLKRNSEELKQLGNFDQATRVYNRSRFGQALSGLLQRDGVRVLMVRLEARRFNEMLAWLGEPACDELLLRIADRLRSVPQLTLVGRLGDSGFGIAVEIENDADATRFADIVHAVLREPLTVLDHEVVVTFSMGLAIGQKGMSASTLQQHSLVALHQGQQDPAGQPRLYDPRFGNELRRRLELGRTVQRAMDDGDLSLFLQPIVSLDDRRLIGAEALVRWRHPLFGLQTPETFLSLSMQTGGIVDIDGWILRNAAALAHRLRDLASIPITVSVNLSARRLRQPGLITFVQEVLKETQVEPAALNFEIPEIALTDDETGVADTLKQLRGLGFGIVLDGFGAATSSLLNLEHIPLTEIKISSHFIHECEHSAYQQTVLESFIAIGRVLSVAVSAKGVETEGQWRVLQRLGLRKGQGFLFGAPMDVAEFIAIVEREAKQTLKSPDPTEIEKPCSADNDP